MNLFFRLAAILIMHIFCRHRLKVADCGLLSFRVWPFDLDLNVHMNNGRYLSIMDLGRLDLMTRLGLTKTVLKKRWMPVLASTQIRYRVPLQPFEKFRLSTKIIWWDEKWFYIEQRFLVTRGDDHNVVAAIGFVKGGFYSPQTKQTVPSSEIESLMDIDETHKPEKQPLIDSWQKAEDDIRQLTAKERA